MPTDISAFTEHDVARRIDFAILDRAGTEQGILDGCAVVRRYLFAGFHVLPCHLSLVVKELGAFARDNSIDLGVPIAFPYGTATPDQKASEASELLDLGATALDMVANAGLLKDGRLKAYEQECVRHVRLCREAGANAKIIIEVGFLSREEVATATRIVAGAGADFVKTATGTGPQGRPDLADLTCILDTLAAEGSATRVKVSGIAEPRVGNAYAFLRMGAHRLGTRAGPEIVDALTRVKQGLVT